MFIYGHVLLSFYFFRYVHILGFNGYLAKNVHPFFVGIPVHRVAAFGRGCIFFVLILFNSCTLAEYLVESLSFFMNKSLISLKKQG